MDQKGDGSNNTQIGSISGEASVIVNQHSEKREPEHAKLEPDYSTQSFVSKTELEKSVKLSLAKLGSVILASFAISADIFGLSVNLGIPAILILPIPLVGGFLLLRPHFRDWRRFMNRPRESRVATFVGEDEVMEDAGEVWHFYKLRAACIYPHCKGKIELTDAPPRERALRTRSYVGICSICGRDHSYRIDGNGVATRAPNMDWRKPEKAKPQSA